RRGPKAPRLHRARGGPRQWQPQPPPQQPPPPPIGADGASLIRAPTFTPPTPDSRTRKSAWSRSGPFSRGRRLLAAALHVTLHELLGVLLEDVVDLVQQVVQVLLDLLALLGELGTPGSAVVPALVGLGRPRLLLLLLSHGSHLLVPRWRDRPQGLDGRQHDPLLALVLPLPVSIRRLAGLVRFEKED